MDDRIDRALARAAGGPDPAIDLDAVAAAARRRRRRHRGAAIAGVVLVLVAVPVAVFVWGDAGGDTVVLAPDGSDTGTPGGDTGGGQPAGYTVTVEASPAGEAPFAITGSQATVAANGDGVPVQLTLTSRQHLLLQDTLGRQYINDRRAPDLAVAGPDCALSEVSDRALGIGCTLRGRVLVIRPDEPLREELAVCLPGTDPVGTYDYTQSIEWWRLDPDSRGRDVSGVNEDQSADGRVDVDVRVRVQPTSTTPHSGDTEQDNERRRCTPPDPSSPTPTPSSPAQGFKAPDGGN